MLTKQAKTNIDMLDKEIGAVLDSLNGLTSDDDLYNENLSQLERLYKIKSELTDKNRVNLKDWLPVLSSIGSVLVIVAFEGAGHTVTSKAMAMLAKPRI